MTPFFRRLRNALPTNRPGTGRRALRPELEACEPRALMAVTYNGGPIIPHVQVESVYFGQGWNQPANQANRSDLDAFLRTLTRGSYFSLLGEYGVGQGRLDRSDLVSGSTSPFEGTTVTQYQIQSMLTAEIQSGRLPEANGSRVYVVYLPPNVHEDRNAFAFRTGHHDSFYTPYTFTSGVYSYTTYDTAYYAVVPSPIGNHQGTVLHLLPTFSQQTEITSKLLAAAITDPDGHSGWYDTDPSSPTSHEEIGDITDQQLASLDGYCVQREWSEAFHSNLAPPYVSSALGTSATSPFMTYVGSTIIHRRRLFIGLGMDGKLYRNWEITPGDNAGWFVADGPLFAIDI
jgi:hypothetical protein